MTPFLNGAAWCVLSPATLSAIPRFRVGNDGHPKLPLPILKFNQLGGLRVTIAGSDWDHRLARLANLDPVLLRRLVDLACAEFAVALFLRLADPEILLQGLWLVVAIGAFVYGLAAALWRIAVACAVMVGYIASLGHGRRAGDPGAARLHRMAADGRHRADRGDPCGPRLDLGSALRDAVPDSASERLVTAHEEERASLARELHDGVGQTLTAVILTLDAVDSELAASGPGRIRRPAAARCCVHASSHRRRSRRRVRSPRSCARPGSMRWGLGGHSRTSPGQPAFPWSSGSTPRSLPPGLLEPELEIDVYRIVQEALSNAARHSRARHVWITAHIVDDTIRLLVGDDGVGFDQPARGQGLGLDGMHERATIHGLELDVRSRRGSGTRGRTDRADRSSAIAARCPARSRR